MAPVVLSQYSFLLWFKMVYPAVLQNMNNIRFLVLGKLYLKFSACADNINVTYYITQNEKIWKGEE